MTQVTIIVAQPPNYEQIASVLPIKDVSGLVFAYGGAIYNPSNAKLTPHIIVHELVHLERQGSASDPWWVSYLGDAEFRLAEELKAHREEFKHMCEKLKDRNARARIAFDIASKLSHSAYGPMCTHKQALEFLCK